jgi:Palmitoyl protein thioesterase
LRPLLVVPGLFSTELYDKELGYLWGTGRCLYGGPPLGALDGLRGNPGRFMRKIPLLLGIAYDLLGALERALVRAGYRTDQNLHFFAYDWRQQVRDIGPQLRDEVRRLADRAGGPIDLLGLSNGGLVIRAAFAADAALPVERVVTSGAPHAGTVETITCLDRGYQFAPFGRTVTPDQFMACPGALEAMPAPGWVEFAPGDGGYDLYDVETWRRLRLSVFRRDVDDPVWVDVVGKRLAAARETWRMLDAAAPPRRLICICGTGLPTQVKIVVRDGRAYLPGEGRLGGVPPEAIADGDGAMTVAACSAWTGAKPEVMRIKVSRHRDTVRTPVAFKAILEALH